MEILDVTKMCEYMPSISILFNGYMSKKVPFEEFDWAKRKNILKNTSINGSPGKGPSHCQQSPPCTLINFLMSRSFFFF